MLERQAPCTTHPWSQGPVPRSSPPLHMSRRSPTPPAMPCQPQWRLQSLQATLGELILEVRWGRDLKAENYLQVLMTYIIQVTKKLTGTKNQHIEVSFYELPNVKHTNWRSVEGLLKELAPSTMPQTLSTTPGSLAPNLENVFAFDY